MLRSIIVSCVRSIFHQRMYTILNMLGIMLGVTIFLTVNLIVHYEWSYDSSVPDAASIYRLDMHFSSPDGGTWEAPRVSFVPYPYLRNIPGINASARVLTQPMPVRVGSIIDSENVTQADLDIFKIFRIETIYGDISQVRSPRDVAISESLSHKYFSNQNSIGRLISVGNAKEPSRVVAVFKDTPQNSSVEFDIVTPFSSDTLGTLPFKNWGSNWGSVLLRINNKADEGRISNYIKGMVLSHRDGISPSSFYQYFNHAFLSLVPLRSIHLYDASLGSGGTSKELLEILEVIGVAALAVGIINYVNLSTARASLRAREVAMRKILGASRRDLFIQFMGEAFILVGLATVMGAILAEPTIQIVNSLGGWSIKYDFAAVAEMSVAIMVVTGFGSGIYPAIVLAHYQPAAVLAANRVPSGGRRGHHIRQYLSTLQFAFAISLAICTMIIASQATFIQKMARGFDQTGVIVISSLETSSLKGQQRDLMERIAAVPGVVLVSRSDISPHHLVNNIGFRREGQDHASRISWGFATPNYFSLLGVRPIAGRLFDDTHGSDVGPGQSHSTINMRSVVVSKLATERLGFVNPAEAVGSVVFEDDNPVAFRIIGVIDDLRLGGATDEIEPLLFLFTRDPIGYARGLVKYSGASGGEIISRLGDVWRASVTDVPLSAETINDIFVQDYRSEQNHGKLFALGSTVAIIIAILGLYSSSSFGALMRRYDIGIRKVCGATTRDIFLLLLLQFSRPVLLANLVAWPVAWVVMRQWLSGFEMRVSLTIIPFVVATSGAILIALAAVTWHALSAARCTPTQALTFE